MNMSVVMGNAMSAMSAGLGMSMGGAGVRSSRERSNVPVESVQMSPMGRSAVLDSGAFPGSVGDLEGGEEGVESQMFPGSDLF